MKSILIIVRTEADFERAIAIGIAAKDSYRLHYVFVGDFSPFYQEGIQNQFQKELFVRSGFEIKDFSHYSLIGRILARLSGNKKTTIETIKVRKKYVFRFLVYNLFNRYIEKKKKRIIKTIFSKINPSILLTDQSLTDHEYLPEMFRAEALKRGVPVYIFTHGAAGGLHGEFSAPNFEAYSGCTVFVCNKNETKPEIKNRIVLGDVASSYSYVKFLNSQDYNEINFLNDRKYRIGIMIGGTAAYTSTSGWCIQEEIIISLSENPDVAMILKIHPRDYNLTYLKMVERFDNLLIVKNETDRSRVTKWANIVITNDHCSTVFEPMILGKKVVAVEGKHLPKYKNNHSPLKESSVNFINHSSQFDLISLKSADPFDKITNKIAWGGNGSIDLAKALLNKL